MVSYVPCPGIGSDSYQSHGVDTSSHGSGSSGMAGMGSSSSGSHSSKKSSSFSSAKKKSSKPVRGMQLGIKKKSSDAFFAAISKEEVGQPSQPCMFQQVEFEGL